MTFVKTLAVGAILASTMATGAFAKAHEQGKGKNGEFNAGTPGEDVSFTVDNNRGAARRAGNPTPPGRPDDVGRQFEDSSEYMDNDGH